MSSAQGIVLSEVTKSFGDPPSQVLHGISLDIREGELVSLTGRSGSGKSTLLYLISTLDTPNSGKVLFSGVDVAAMDVRELHEFRNLKVGFVFQFHHLLPELTALENVMMPAMKTRQESERRPRGIELLTEFGLADKLDRVPGKLSGGEQQRVAIARALIMNPKFIFADEPTGNLDSVNGDLVMKLLERINRERGTTIVYVTHDPVYANLGRRRIDLADGKVLSDGRPLIDPS